MSDRYRDLEELGHPGRKDAVLLATVTSFEGMARPSRHDLEQFQLLFLPLFENAGAEARRIAAASLSQSPFVPAAVSQAIASQPIEVAAPYLVNSTSLDDALLIDVVRRIGGAHARAIARRAALSPPVLAALGALGVPAIERSLRLRQHRSRKDDAAPEADPQSDAGHDSRIREDAVRNELRKLAMNRSAQHPAATETPQRRIDPLVEERLTRHANAGEPIYFATALADALGSSFALAERIMLDVSGRQLGETLVALGLRYTLIIVALERFFPHLAEGSGASRRSLRLLRSCSYVECIDRVTAWQRADLQTSRRAVHEPLTVDAPSAQHRRQGTARDSGAAAYLRRKSGTLKRA